MARPISKNPACPDCGSRAVKEGKRDGSTVQRYKCKGEVIGTKCEVKPRRFTELTKNTKLEDASTHDIEIVPARASVRDDTHVFVITYAQNATDIEDNFWGSMQGLIKHRNGDLIVQRGRYSNPTRMKEHEHDLFWDARIEPYAYEGRHDLCPILTLMCDINVRPTAQYPLTGYDSISGGKSCIIGHPKLTRRDIATPQADHPKQMMTTGACTVQNYSNSGVGKKGHFHHTIGALIVEVRGGVFFARQINATKDGSFIDLNTEYLPDGTWREAPRALALSMGDWHDGFTDPDVIRATFEGPDSICGVLRPEQILWDDTLDQYSRNHHHKDNPFIAYAKQFDSVYDRGDLRCEVETACENVKHYTAQAVALAGGPVKSVVKSSNHDDALTRYVIDGNWKNDPINARFYLQTADRMLEQTEMARNGAQYPSAFGVWAAELMPDTLMLGRRGSYMIGGIECIFHGDIGPNGARGSIMNFSKIGVKTVIAHAHTAGIIGGCYQVGTSTYLDLEYARGPSSWSNTHCAIYGNGKRTLLTIIGGEWKHD